MMALFKETLTQRVCKGHAIRRLAWDLLRNHKEENDPRQDCLCFHLLVLARHSDLSSGAI